MEADQTAITIMSFGFKHGTPNDVNVLMDVRFLQNPHWIEDLKPLNGLDKSVGDYIKQDPKFNEFFESFTASLAPLLQHHTSKNNNITIAIGCTGGQHRSVFIVEALGKWLETQNYQPNIKHRELDF